MPDRPENTKHRARSCFLPGLAAGLVGALALVVLNDTSLRLLPAPGSARAGTSAAVVPGRALFVPGELPAGVDLRVDGRPVEPRAVEGGILVPWPEGASRVAFIGDRGVLWTATYPGGDAPDTLAPVLGGEVVVEIARQGPTGEVLLDGRPVGPAPATATEVPAGWHVVSLVEDGRVLFESECRVRPGEVTRIVVPPAPPWGRGQILVRTRVGSEELAEPSAGETVWLDGMPIGRAPLEYPVAAGHHSVRVEMEGFPAHVEVVYVAAGESRALDASFGRATRLDVEVSGAAEYRGGVPAALPVRISALGDPVVLGEGAFHLVRPGHQETVEVPLVGSGTESDLWVAVLPAELVSGAPEIRGFVRCRDEQGREGVSEILAFAVR